jgi:imidazolonepropionase
MRLLITNIKQLCGIDTDKKRIAGKDMATLSCMENAWLLAEDGLIHSYGSMTDLPFRKVDQTYNADDRLVLPAWCDSHTHLVFAASREHEFVDRIKGLSYEEIARRGGGILNSAKKLNETSAGQLYDQSLERLHKVMATGTGAIEIKSGYGLNEEGKIEGKKPYSNKGKFFSCTCISN